MIFYSKFIVLILLSVCFGKSLIEEDGYSQRNYRPYQTVTIDDPAEQSAGIYLRISQKGVDYLAQLVSDGLPEIFDRLVFPKISESGLTIKDAVITKLARPDIGVKFIKGEGLISECLIYFLGVDLAIRLPELILSGDAELQVLLFSYRAMVLAIATNITVNMRVNIHRNMNEVSTNVSVTKCSVNPGLLDLQYFGNDAGEFYTIGNLIQSELYGAIRDKICILPPLVKEFPPSSSYRRDTRESHLPKAMELRSGAYYPPPIDSDPSVLDHLCENIPLKPSFDKDGALKMALNSSPPDDDEPDVDMMDLDGTWVPDLSLRYPPTFSDKDLIFGIDGGLIVDGVSASNFIERPKFDNITVRDQIKPHFRHNRLFSDVLLGGVDLKVYKAGLSGVQIPRLCTLEFNHLHWDYVRHAAILSGDFDVDLPLLIKSFKHFMDEKLRNTNTKVELDRNFRYL